MRRARPPYPATALLLALAALAPRAGADEGLAAVAERFREQVEPVLIDRCFACHGSGINKGGVALDAFGTDAALVADPDLWARVLRNVRAGLMPPRGEERPTAEEVAALVRWIKRDAFGLDPAHPDPGRVTLRRLNRAEYGHTIADLMGYDFKAEEEFPPDDTGYGFDNIGDVLTVSPLLMEKYMQAAESIVAAAVPTVSRVVPARTLAGPEFRREGGDGRADRLSFYEAASVAAPVTVEHEGTYRLVIELGVRGSFDFDPGRCRVTLRADGRELKAEELGWASSKTHRYEFTEHWAPGEHRLALDLEPLTPADQKADGVTLRVASVRVEGPQEREHWVRPGNFDRFFSEDDPGTPEGRRRYAREALRRFATRAFRRPVDDGTVGRLADIAESAYEVPGKTVEEGIARAMVAVLASPRFLFRVEADLPEDAGRPDPRVDEYALASRLSYFLWSTMPDDELTRLAERGELRAHFDEQVAGMMADPRSGRMIRNFVGQWLQARDVEGISIDARTVLARDDGKEKALQEQAAEFRAFLAERMKDKDRPRNAQDRARIRERFKDLFAPPRVELDGELRTAMRRETEMFFEAVLREDRSLLDLLDSDYTFANEKLAKFYGIEGVTGEEMRRVALPEGSPRGGVLTQGTVLVVTSNPTRTSPVKRGLFLLDNILGSPPPPPPPDIPQLEESEKAFAGREPTLREVLELHRDKPLCRSCHARMDPLGLSLESFNAMGLYREAERGQPLDTAGTLVTGEPFREIRDLKRILREERRGDFYRCLTEKFLTFALGRGLEYYDVETVDRIVGRLEAEGGRASALLGGILESAPFQRRRGVTAATASAAAPGPSARPLQTANRP